MMCDFQNEDYLSDSRIGFRDKNPYQTIKCADTNLLQVLLHPIHFSETESTSKEILKELAIKKIDELDLLIRPFNNKFVEELESNKIIDLL